MLVTRRINKWKTMAEVTIDANTGFSLHCTTANAKNRRAVVQVVVEAEKLICRNFSIVRDGRDVTKDALEVLGCRFQHEVSPSVLATLRALLVGNMP
ncbi:hypothetical protein ZWY2020_052570 [Hordeum vulgare]|nr:hypothetical protein ZWY2020_052570 [Hordeum vulgare]